MSYDPKCEELAEHFLTPHTALELRHELAQHIQDEIEIWLEIEQQRIARLIVANVVGCATHQ